MTCSAWPSFRLNSSSFATLFISSLFHHPLHHVVAVRWALSVILYKGHCSTSVFHIIHGYRYYALLVDDFRDLLGLSFKAKIRYYFYLSKIYFNGGKFTPLSNKIIRVMQGRIYWSCTSIIFSVKWHSMSPILPWGPKKNWRSRAQTPSYCRNWTSILGLFQFTLHYLDLCLVYLINHLAIPLVKFYSPYASFYGHDSTLFSFANFWLVMLSMLATIW